MHLLSLWLCSRGEKWWSNCHSLCPWMLRQFWTNSQAVSCVLQKGGVLTVGALVLMAMPADTQTTGCALWCWGTFNSSPRLTCPCRASDKELILPHMFALLSGTEYPNQGWTPFSWHWQHFSCYQVPFLSRCLVSSWSFPSRMDLEFSAFWLHCPTVVVI